MALHPPPPSVPDAAVPSAPTEPVGTDAPETWGEAARSLSVVRSRTVPAYSQATWGLAVHALGQALRQEGRDAGDHWHGDADAPVRAHLSVAPGSVAPGDEDVRVTLALERTVLGSQIWALPILFWPFAFLLALLVARGELPWAFWIVPALFGLAPSFLLGLRWAGHRAWTALALRRARRALDAFADAVVAGNRLEAPPARRFALPASGAPRTPVSVDDDAWDDEAWDVPFVAPDVEALASLDLWFSPDEAAALDAVCSGGIALRATAPVAGDGATHPIPDSAVSGAPSQRLPSRLFSGEGGRVPQPWRIRRRRPASPSASGDGWTGRTLLSGFGEWLPERTRAEAPGPRR